MTYLGSSSVRTTFGNSILTAQASARGWVASATSLETIAIESDALGLGTTTACRVFL